MLVSVGAVAVIALVSLGLWLSDGGNDLTLRGLSGSVLNFGGMATATPPSTERSLNFPASFPQEARTILENQVKTLREHIVANPQDATPWLDLAIQYKTIEDYEGAKEVWEYLDAAYPQDSIAAHNLGNLYHLFLKDYPKAEMYYREAIKRNPRQTLHYVGLHELYRYSYKQDTAAVVEVLEDGLSLMPDAIDLMATFGGYYREKGDKLNAVKYFTQARDEAKKRGNTALASQFDNELATLH